MCGGAVTEEQLTEEPLIGRSPRAKGAHRWCTARRQQGSGTEGDGATRTPRHDVPAAAVRGMRWQLSQVYAGGAHVVFAPVDPLDRS